MWTLPNLLRLAHSDACADLSDLARSSATTYADSFDRGGELVEEADRLVSAAEEIRVLAVAAERARGVSWEAIGGALGGVSRQAAQKRFSDRVDELKLDVLLPDREGAQGAPAWTAGPDAVARPDQTLERLDAWARRHHERTDGGKELVDRLVSHGLRVSSARVLDYINVVTKLADLLMNATGTFATRELPPGVSERYVRRRLLEAKVALYDAMQAESTAVDDDARAQAARAFAELVELRIEDARGLLRIDWATDEEAAITVGDHRVALLARTIDRVDRDVCGWWLWGVSKAGEAGGRGGAWPQLVDEDLDVEREHLEHAALETIASWIGSDLAKGITPFGPGGIAGPDAATAAR